MARKKLKHNEAVAALSALAQDARLAIFRLLVAAGPNGLPVGKIAETLEIAPTTLSFHLQQLNHSGLIAARRNGRQIIQSAAFERMSDLISFLTDNCCGGDPSACLPSVSGRDDRNRKQQVATRSVKLVSQAGKRQ